VIDFGGVSGIDYLDYELGIGISLTSYFAPIIADLKAVGYQVGKNLRGAPFDWRKAENPDNFFDKLQKLVEDTYVVNQNTKVTLLAHSMGGIHVTQFLNQMTQPWKDKYVANLISVATPWSGSPKALRAIISGDNFGIEVTSWLPLIDKMAVRPTLRRSGGTILMLPENAFYNNTVLVKTPKRTYSSSDFHQLFKDLGTPITSEIYDSLDGVVENIKAPQVPMHCLYGENFPTEDHYEYRDGWDKDPIITNSQKGDGTVPEFSLTRCKTFATQQPHPVIMKDFDLADHLSVLNDEELLQYVLSIVVKN